MENATKALLIAAAILIAIVLVSIGVFVLRQGQDAMDSVDMSEAQIIAFNSNFEAYAGTQRGSQVNALLQRVVSSNSKSGGDTPVTVSGAGVTIDKNTKKAPTVATANFYKVTINKDTTNGTGLVTSITLEQIK